jgi:hypothetical protein
LGSVADLELAVNRGGGCVEALAGRRPRQVTATRGVDREPDDGGAATGRARRRGGAHRAARADRYYDGLSVTNTGKRAPAGGIDRDRRRNAPVELRDDRPARPGAVGEGVRAGSPGTPGEPGECDGETAKNVAKGAGHGDW